MNLCDRNGLSVHDGVVELCFMLFSGRGSLPVGGVTECAGGDDGGERLRPEPPFSATQHTAGVPGG